MTDTIGPKRDPRRTGPAWSSRTATTNHLREIRFARGLSMEAVAARAGLSWSTLQAYETGRTSALTVRALVLLARALRCRPTDLVPALGAAYGPTSELAELRAAGLLDGLKRTVVEDAECAVRADFRAGIGAILNAAPDPEPDTE